MAKSFKIPILKRESERLKTTVIDPPIPLRQGLKEFLASASEDKQFDTYRDVTFYARAWFGERVVAVEYGKAVTDLVSFTQRMQTEGCTVWLERVVVDRLAIVERAKR